MPSISDSDFDAPLPTAASDDLHLRINSKMSPAPPVRPPSLPHITTSIAEQKRLATDMTVSPEIRQRAIDVLKVFTAGYAAADEDFEGGAPAEYKHGMGILAIMKSGRADFACLDFQD